ncbi:MAG TPA: MoaD/ThiS family protein [Methylomirabilota bacterium]|nr:MoaD/ThiS family protein [Methylomirabilota bacterium]
MKVRLRLFATLAQYLPSDADGDGVTLVLPDGARVSDALSALRIPAREEYVIAVNGAHREGNARLVDGDEVTLFPPLSGGSAP